jgi:ParB family chromosome partitioning protein
MSVTKTAKNKGAEKSLSSGLGLESIGDLSGLLNEPAAHFNSATGPQEVHLYLIDEDPNQPRKENNPGFSAESLDELASTIRARGVKSPISVRENHAVPGRYLINHGSRRYRAAKRAGKETVPVFIDNDYNEIDQIIENLQRNELTAREIADFIGRELAKGKKKGEIAKEIGKSPAFVTQHVTLLDLPESIAQVFNNGRAKDVTVVNELVTAYRKNPEEVQVWLADGSQEMTRGSVKLLREFLDAKRSHEAGDPDLKTTDENSIRQSEVEEEKKERKVSATDRLKKTVVQVRRDDRPARLILNRRPPTDGWAWLKYEDDGQECEADLATVQLVALIEG